MAFQEIDDDLWEIIQKRIAINPHLKPLKLYLSSSIS